MRGLSDVDPDLGFEEFLVSRLSGNVYIGNYSRLQRTRRGLTPPPLRKFIIILKRSASLCLMFFANSYPTRAVGAFKTNTII